MVEGQRVGDCISGTRGINEKESHSFLHGSTMVTLFFHQEALFAHSMLPIG